MRVLVVDDEPAILRSTQLLLEDVGWEVLALSNHLQALEALPGFQPDVILQDVRMPGLRLEEYLPRVRKESPARIVLFSASIDLDGALAALPVDARLEKPFKPHQLFEAVQPTAREGAPLAAAR